MNLRNSANSGFNSLVSELAGKAVGAAFVGARAASLAVAEAVREFPGGRGHDVLVINLDGAELNVGVGHPCRAEIS
jgi:hypothetical protein